MIKTMSVSLVTLSALLSFNALAQGVDLKKNMQAMKLAFKQAAEAQTVEEMKQPVAKLDRLVAETQRGQYPAEKTDLYMEGFNKLSGVVKQVDSELEQGDLEAAKQTLREVDSLRLEYHDKRNPSIWKRLFG
ncbi:soluble cytochrome b562 [Vibrio hangzhouensis]|uniref:Soluble cytochrome b562 n=2 Tax=Vibrio hangzhouensis TaxID=462991 RepID=A0A1H5WR85_9VIBR|nr:soluble cytochrome b562 [Vibrio hangzhouensis]